MRSSLLRTVFALALVGAAAAGGPALAGDERPLDIAPAPLQNDFKSRLSEIGTSLENLNAQIAQSLKEIDTLTDPKAARGQLEKVQGYIAEALAKVSDNGDVAEIGRKAEAFAQDKLNHLPDSKFSPEQRATLMSGWQKVKTELDVQIAGLTSLRQELAGLLRTVQQRSDYLSELQALDDGNKMLEVIRDLSGQIRTTSQALRDVLRSTGEPGS